MGCSLNMLIETTDGFDFTGADCRAWMHDAGFKETRVELLCGPDSMVIGQHEPDDPAEPAAAEPAQRPRGSQFPAQPHPGFVEAAHGWDIAAASKPIKPAVGCRQCRQKGSNLNGLTPV